ncbi:hypothetical protein IKE96_03165 [bacterium]|nr:hypothetical protein [bacterium]
MSDDDWIIGMAIPNIKQRTSPIIAKIKKILINILVLLIFLDAINEFFLKSLL